MAEEPLPDKVKSIDNIENEVKKFEMLEEAKEEKPKKPSFKFMDFSGKGKSML